MNIDMALLSFLEVGFLSFILQEPDHKEPLSIWNLVLSCKDCNRGEDGKFASVPELHLLQRLFTRNEFFIQSHHPLRETLINQTGKTTEYRSTFLQSTDKIAIESLIHRWKPKFELDVAF